MLYFSAAHIKFLLFAILFFGTTAKISAVAAGDLDPTFDGDGIVVTDNGSSNEIILDLTVQPDGKIIAAGNSWVGSSWRTVIVRYNSNGSIDATFGTSGKILIPTVLPEQLVLQPNGKIVFAGTHGTYGIGDFYIARLNSDGSFDTTFNGTGAVILDLRGTNDNARSVKIQADEKIVVGGGSARTLQGSSDDAALVRLNADGSYDTTFDGDGKVFTMVTPDGGSIAKLAIQPDGKIVAAGTAATVEPPSTQSIETFVTLRYNSDGSPDMTFDTDAKVFTRFISTGPFGSLPHNRVGSLIIQTDGKILVGGTAGTCCSPVPMGQVALVRHNADGSPDSSFGTGGKALIPYNVSLAVGASDLAIQADNKIVIAVRAGNGKNAYYAVARANADGSLDTSFSGDGWNILFTPFGTAFSETFAVALQPDGKIITGGYINVSPEGNFMLARYLAAAPRAAIADFDGDGKSDISVFRPADGDWHLLRSATQDWLPVHFGANGDKISPADYDGDGRTDISVFRDGVWYWLNSSNNSFSGMQFGINSDKPVPADYTGDGRAELAVYRDGVWYTLDLTNPNQYQAAQFGIASDKPVPADFDADGKTDFAVYRDGYWYIQRSSQGFLSIYFGNSTDKPVVGDYDGDRRADAALYRSDAWHILGSTQGYYAAQFGVVTDIPAPADYDGDGKTDLAVFRNGIWYVLQSTNGFASAQFGQTGDKPVPNAYIP